MAVGDPTGAFLCSKTENTYPPGNITFVQNPAIPIQAGKQYAIVVSTTGLDVSNYTSIPQKTGGGYSGGLKCISSDAGGSWTQVATRDLRFHIYDSTDTLQDYWSVFDAFQAVYGNYHIAQTFTAQNSYTIKSIVLATVETGDISGGTITCGIKAVEGESYDEFASKPINPDPEDDATDVDFSDTTLTWEDGGGAESYNVYVGDAADNLTQIISSYGSTSIALTSTQRALFTNHCYWRIDANAEAGTTTGDVWDFTVAAPGKAQNPTPSDGTENIKITGGSQLRRLEWEAPS